MQVSISNAWHNILLVTEGHRVIKPEFSMMPLGLTVF